VLGRGGALHSVWAGATGAAAMQVQRSVVLFANIRAFTRSAAVAFMFSIN
jgi:hypothetical protein